MGIGINSLVLSDGEGWFETEPLEGHPVRFNISGHALPIVSIIAADFFFHFLNTTKCEKNPQLFE